jgi:hypothetical protein
MSQEPEVKAAMINSRSGIIIAIIGLIGGLLIAILPPFVAKLASTPAMPKGLSMEKIEQQVFAYYGEAENVGGFAKFDLAYDGVRERPSYVLNYNIPGDQAGYAGLAFQFKKSLNAESYQAIEFEIQFDAANVPIDFYLKDANKNGTRMRILSTGTDPIKMRYELSNFREIEFNALKEIGFNSDNTFSTGRHIVTIRAIQFVP